MQSRKFSFRKGLRILVGILLLGGLGYLAYDQFHPNRAYAFGDPMDELNGVSVYYNGRVGTVEGRNVAPNGYNLGLKYQCVEFVKRYYFEHLGHQMPDSYGHAKDFFNPGIQDGGFNRARGLRQFSNPSATRPQPNDLLVFGPTWRNAYGHVAIISKVSDEEIEIIQQNAGRNGSTREEFELDHADGKWEIQSGGLLGWLRKK